STMTSAISRRLVALSLAALLSASHLYAGDLYSSSDAAASVVLPKPGEIKDLTAYPAKIALKGGDDANQLVVTAALTSGRLQDLSGNVQYTVADEKIVKVTAAGRVVPQASGSTTITAKFLDKSVTVPVTAISIEENLPINFSNQVVPVFSK